MYDDFWAGYNYGSGNRQPVTPVEEQREDIAGKKVTLQKPPVYDKSKFIRMRGPNNEIGEFYADGKMYIYQESGGRIAKATFRKFGSRPSGIRYMQRKGWVLI